MTRLRHQILDSGVLITGEAAGRPVSLRVTETEAKRFAWAILADLDPQDDLADRPRARAGQQRSAVLRALASRPVNTAGLASVIERTVHHTAVVTNALQAKGLIRCVERGIPNTPAIWGITDAGLQHLARKQAA